MPKVLSEGGEQLITVLAHGRHWLDGGEFLRGVGIRTWMVLEVGGGTTAHWRGALGVGQWL